MKRTRRISLALAALLAGLAAVPVLGLNQRAEAARGVKFFVVEWKLTWERGAPDMVVEGDRTTKVLALRIEGRASLDGKDFDKDFEMDVADATPFLDILRTCGSGRMTGTVLDYETVDSKVVGREMDSLSCRAILK